MNELSVKEQQTTELFKVNMDSEQITLSARDLHEFLEVGTLFKDWVVRMFEYGFEEGLDFNPLKIERVQIEGNREVTRELTDYQLTIDMAKEIAMLQRNEKGKQARQYFIELEKQWNSPESIMQRALTIANKRLDEYKQKVIEMKPKADFFDSVACSKTAISMNDVAKVLEIKGLGRNNLFKILREKKILMDNNTPYQEYVDRGYFRVIESKYTKPSGETCISIKTLVYQKGVEYIKRVVS